MGRVPNDRGDEQGRILVGVPKRRGILGQGMFLQIQKSGQGPERLVWGFRLVHGNGFVYDSKRKHVIVFVSIRRRI